jgi:hypothetical protein
VLRKEFFPDCQAYGQQEIYWHDLRSRLYSFLEELIRGCTASQEFTGYSMKRFNHVNRRLYSFSGRLIKDCTAF